MKSFFSRIFSPAKPSAINAGNVLRAATPEIDRANFRVSGAFVLALAVSITVFMADMTVPGHIICTVPYVFLVLTGISFPIGHIYAVAGFGAFLTFLGYLHSTSVNGVVGEMVYNRAFCAVAIWVAAVLLHAYKRSQEKLYALHTRLAHVEKLSSIGKLSASIAHEFNNPIYGIRNVLEQIREEARLDEDLEGLAKMAVKECDRIANLTAKLRDFYSLSPARRVLMDIHEIIDDLIALNKGRWIEQKIHVVRNYAPNMPKIEAIPDQIKQAILNLLQNSEESFLKEGGEIAITTKVFPETIEVQIQDTGGGIAPEHIGAVFEPFFTTKSAVKGTGLGLSVSYGIIKDHGGTIRVESQPGKGAIFAIVVPIKYSGGGGG